MSSLGHTYLPRGSELFPFDVFDNWICTYITGTIRCKLDVFFLPGPSRRLPDVSARSKARNGSLAAIPNLATPSYYCPR